MDRVTIYAGQQPLETDLLQAQQNANIAIGELARACLGKNTAVTGFSIHSTSPASLTVLLDHGQIFTLGVVEASQWSSLPADSRELYRHGIKLDQSSFTFAAPSTPGFAQNFLIQAAYQELDTNPVERPYYDADNPAVAFQGPGGDGVADNTNRKNTVVVSVKNGTAAASGSQVTPTPDPGYVGLYVITVTQGQTSIDSSSWATYNPSSFIPVRLPEIPADIQNNVWNYAQGTGSASALAASISPAPTALVAGMQVLVKSPFTNTGNTTFNLNNLGVKPLLARDGTQLKAGDIVNQQIVLLVYNGAAWQLQSDRSAVAATVNIADSSLWHIGTAAAGSPAATALTTTLSPVPGSAAVGLCMRVPITTTNGANPTIDFGFGPKPIVKDSTGVALAGGEMVGGVGYYADFIYDGTNARLINPLNFALASSGAVFSTPGSTTWTCPAGVYRVKARVWGAGGGGGSSGAGTNASGCGGNGGGYAEGYVNVTPGTVYGVTVGQGGAGFVSVAGQNGSTGGSSGFAGTITATGGGGGGGSTAGVSGLYGVASGTVGNGSGGTFQVSGSVAANAYPGYGSGGGGAFGTSGTGMSISGGIGANYPGGGGGGAANGYGGQVGANGCVALEW